MRQRSLFKMVLIIMVLSLWFGGAVSWAAKISEYEMAPAPSVEDVLIGTDVSDTTMSSVGTTKKFRLQDLPVSDPVQSALDCKMDADALPGVAPDGADGLAVDGAITSAGKPVAVYLETLADLLSYTGPATTVFVRGRTAPGDGYEGMFQLRLGDYSARCTADTLHGVYAAKSGVAASTGCWVRAYPGRIDIRWFGAVPNNIAVDSTAAINAAIAISCAIGNYAGAGAFPGVAIPAGIWYCHDIAWDNCSSIVGAEVGSSVLRYNGSGGAGTAVIRNANNASEWGATPYAGFYNLVIWGFDGTVGHGIAQYGYLMPGAGGTDWGAKFENLQFLEIYGNAIDLSGGGIVNIHMNRMRFDSIGGFCVALASNQYHEARPVSLTQFTLDNNIGGNFATQAAAMGYYDGTHWGKGVLKLSTGTGISVHFSDGRIELNKRLIVEDTRPCMFYMQVPAWSLGCIALHNVGGFFQPADAGSVVFAKTGWVNFTGIDTFFYNCPILYEDYDDQTKSVRNSGQRIASSTRNSLTSQGTTLNGNQIEYRSAYPAPGDQVYTFYTAGDVIFSTAGSGNVGWVCTWPTDGFARPATASFGSCASIASGSTTVTISSADAFKNLFVNAYVVITGAGVSGANLTAKITAVDNSAGTVTIGTAASTTVTSAGIAPAQPTFQKFGATFIEGWAWYDPGSLLNNTGETSGAITVSGAVLGDAVIVSAPYDLQGMDVTGYVSAASTVRIRVTNHTGATLDLSGGTWKVRVLK